MKVFLSHINNVLTQSELSRTERRQLEEMLKSLLENYTPEELLQVLLEMIGPMHKTTCQV
ncbi:hypothetical protein CIRMBP1273_02283 [Enterococcus cecorum]|nr:hypothetical protein CIRMBP1273_02283 [Enterococcus cecorum]